MSVFNELPILQDDQDKLASATLVGLHEFKKMPMGLSTSCQNFQWSIKIVFKGLIRQICMSYIDNMVVYSPSKEEHVFHLDMMFEVIQPVP